MSQVRMKRFESLCEDCRKPVPLARAYLAPPVHGEHRFHCGRCHERALADGRLRGLAPTAVPMYASDLCTDCARES